MKTKSRHQFWMQILSWLNLVSSGFSIGAFMIMMVTILSAAGSLKSSAHIHVFANQWFHSHQLTIVVMVLVLFVLFIILFALNIWQLMYQHNHQLLCSGAIISVIGSALIVLILPWLMGLAVLLVGSITSLTQVKASDPRLHA